MHHHRALSAVLDELSLPREVSSSSSVDAEFNDVCLMNGTSSATSSSLVTGGELIMPPYSARGCMHTTTALQ